MPSSDIEQSVINYLSKFQITAEKIPESNEKTPDFIIRGNPNVLIELKEKFNEPSVHLDKETTLNAGETYQYSHTTGYWRTVATVISKGAKQLKSQKASSNSKYCLIFIVTSGVSPSIQAKQFESTLYGIKSIINFESESNQAIWCFYHSQSEFVRHKNIIDGAFIVCNETVKLLLNDKSPQYHEFKSSSFVNNFTGKVEVVDPPELEKKGLIYLADTNIPRNKESKVKKYVFKKYGIKLGLVLDFPQTTTIV
jgi:hypothetical protein